MALSKIMNEGGCGAILVYFALIWIIFLTSKKIEVLRSIYLYFFFGFITLYYWIVLHMGFDFL